MTTKNTILSQKDHNLLEGLIAQHGEIVQFEDIIQVAQQYTANRQLIRNWVNKLTHTGWLIRLQRGTYAISTMESLGVLTLSSLTVAQAIVPQSYISFEAALQHHNMFDQMLQRIRSISLKKQSDKVVQNIKYQFIHTTVEQFYGFSEEQLDHRSIKIATPEKALLDLIHFQRSLYTIDLVLEKCRDYNRDINFSAVIKLLGKQTVTVQRIMGFLLDQLNIDTKSAYSLVENNRSISRMTADSKVFNAKWRLYYHEHFKQLAVSPTR